MTSRLPLEALLLLFLTAELYLLLSAEALAVRHLGRFTEYAGSAAALLVALLISALVLGYRVGQSARTTLRKQLALTLPLSLLFLVPALSPGFLEPFFKLWGGAGLGTPSLRAALYAVGLLVFPTVCLGYGLPALGRALARTTAHLSAQRRFTLVACALLLSSVAAALLNSYLSAQSALLCTLCLPALAHLPLVKRRSGLLLYGAALGAALLFALT